ncbi:hypothetical protein IQ266_19635 [filamentous cyanobacterium LEGE 11480]|uniref:Uncharacterized protein n=1 Tax=Romeriopsis navalis LEGE 11480 TaxID=2777977 RepID=A0A928Z5F8_9CYAN|nr:hypothetical protein [Romeriopsis navalis]MBE9031952.1 hypothetical protein [Romeriopsis navalis LEGE 11480]
MFTYEIIGISPTWHYIQLQHDQQDTNTTYIANQEYHLKTLIETIENMGHKRPRDQERMINAVYEFWVEHLESVKYWRTRLAEVGSDNVLISRFRIAENLRNELEALLET